jgi:hypothetical protein
MAYLSKYGVARKIRIPMVKRAVVDHAVGADWTPAAGDVKISKDGGAAANVTNLPTAIAMGNSAIWEFSLTAAEMQAAQINVTVADSATKAVEDNGLRHRDLRQRGRAAPGRPRGLGARRAHRAAQRTAGQIAAAFKKFFDKASPTGTINSLPDAVPGAAGGLLVDDVWTDARAAKLDNLDAAISSRLATAGYTAPLDAAGTRAALGMSAADLDAQLDALATELANVEGFLDTEISDILAVTNKLNTALELDGAVYRFTTNALEQAPTGGGSDPWNVALPGAYAAGKAGFILGTFLDLAVSTRLATAGYTAPLSAAGTRAALGMAAADLDTQLAAIITAVGTRAAAGDAMTLTAGERLAVADALLARNVAGGGSGTRTVKEALAVLRNRIAVAGGTMTVYAADDVTPLWTAVATQTAGNPVSEIDPT